MKLIICYMLFTILVLVLRACASLEFADVDQESRPVESFGLKGSNPEQPPAVSGVASPNTTTLVTKLGSNGSKPDRLPVPPGIVSLNTTTAVMGLNSPNGSQPERPAAFLVVGSPNTANSILEPGLNGSKPERLPAVLAVRPHSTTKSVVDSVSVGNQTLQVPCQGDKCPTHQRHEAMKPVIRSLQSGSPVPEPTSRKPYERLYRPCPVCGRQPCRATQCSCRQPRPCCRKQCPQPVPCTCKLRSMC